MLRPSSHILPVKSVAFVDFSGAPVFSEICSGGLPGGLSLLKPGHRIRLQGPEQLPRGPIGDYVVRNEGALFYRQNVCSHAVSQSVSFSFSILIM